MQIQGASLLGRVLDSHRYGLSHAVKPSRNLERIYDTMHVLAMAQRLKVKEIMTLGQATDARERGLQAARNGNLEDATTFIAEARRIYSTAELSTEAAACAESFQTAAESYVQYKAGDYVAAAHSMTLSLQICEVLASECEYPLEIRRIHLARNIARVRASAGNESEALRISLGLLRYIGLEESAWPFPCIGRPRRHLLEDAAALLMLDQVLAEALRLLEPGRAAAIEKLPAVEDTRSILVSGSFVFQRAAYSLAACSGYIQSDVDVFLENAGAFFEGGPQSLESAWREMERKLLPFAAGGPGI